MTRDIQRIGIIGCGTMGSALAQVCAAANLDVRVAVSTPGSIPDRRTQLNHALQRTVDKGTITQADCDATRRRITVTSDLDDMADRDLIIESVIEHEDTKIEIFSRIDKIVTDRTAIFASNTSSLSIMKLACVTSRPHQVIGSHFFNPVQKMPLVEVVPSLCTGDETTDRLERFLTDVLDKQVIRSRDRAGFLVNALLIPYLLSAITMVETGFTSAADIDKAMRLGCAHPIGPLELVDLIGLDVVAGVAEALHAEFRERHHAPPPLLRRMIEAGRLGKKTGGGFYEYA